MKLRIVSDDFGVRVIDPESGAELDGVISVKWECNPYSGASAEIKLVNVQLDVECDEPLIIKIDPEVMDGFT